MILNDRNQLTEVLTSAALPGRAGGEDFPMIQAYITTDVSIEKFVGENYSAFELLELKACCNKTNLADTEESIWDYEFIKAGSFNCKAADADDNASRA